MTLARASLCLLVVAFGSGCKTEGLHGGDGADLGRTAREPLVHRPVAMACPTDRPATTCYADVDMGCGGGCTAGTNGRCVGNAHDGCSCSYDTCSTDGDCASGELCACRNQWHYGANGPNVCLPSDCRVDADCGDNGFCSPSLDASCGAYFGITSWHCHTPKDKCLDDRDCANVDGGYGTPFCGYQPELGYWACSTSLCVG